MKPELLENLAANSTSTRLHFARSAYMGIKNAFILKKVVKYKRMFCF